uniref:Uncharacterized protein n=1 Tax=Anguilla anguilla TaxID=7936 RepID=A0A0E9WB73_ANGAN
MTCSSLSGESFPHLSFQQGLILNSSVDHSGAGVGRTYA